MEAKQIRNKSDITERKYNVAKEFQKVGEGQPMMLHRFWFIKFTLIQNGVVLDLSRYQEEASILECMTNGENYPDPGLPQRNHIQHLKPITCQPMIWKILTT